MDSTGACLNLRGLSSRKTGAASVVTSEKISGKKLKTDRTGRILLAIILALALSVILFTFEDYGIGWDESVYAEYGEMVVAYFRSGLLDQRCNNFIDLKYYGSLFEATVSSIYLFAGKWKYEIRHFCTALTALLALAGVMKLGRMFSNPMIAVWSAISLIMLPRFYGHAFINSKDIPFAAFFVWAMVAMSLLFSRKESIAALTAFTGLTIGLALSVRVGGFLLFCFLGAGAFFYFVTHVTPSKCRQMFSANRLNLLIVAASIISIAWFVMIAFWPWAHGGIISNPIAAFTMATNFHIAYPVLFGGKLLMSNQLPWDYLPRYLLITTPPTLLFFSVIGLVRCIALIRRKAPETDGLLCFWIVLWFFFPIFFVIASKPNIYDGIRHFLFILPALAIMSGIGISWIPDLFPKPARVYVQSAAFILLILPAMDLIDLHPYQMTYFNAFAGGLENAGKKYETDYWTTSYKEAIQWINKQTDETDAEKSVVNVLVAGNNYNRPCAEYYRSPHLSIRMIFPIHRQKSLPPGIDYYVSTTRYNFHLNFPNAPVVHTIGRRGAVFTVIRKKPASHE